MRQTLRTYHTLAENCAFLPHTVPRSHSGENVSAYKAPLFCGQFLISLAERATCGMTLVIPVAQARNNFLQYARTLLLYAGRGTGLRWAPASSRSTATRRPSGWGWPCRARNRYIFPCETESLACMDCAPIATQRRGLNLARLYRTL
jgi:hypothetical protein